MPVRKGSEQMEGCLGQRGSRRLSSPFQLGSSHAPYREGTLLPVGQATLTLMRGMGLGEGLG